MSELSVETIDAMIDVKRDKMRLHNDWQDWMANWVTFDVKTYHSGVPICIIVCWHPDMTPFYVSSSIDDAIAAFTKYPYKG